VADLLRGVLPAGVRVVVAATDPMTLMDAWDGAAAVFLVDATRGGAPPGTVHRFEGIPAELPAEPPRASTHGLGLATALRLADTLDRLPPRVVLYGIEGVCFDIGAAPSPAVQAAAREVAARIRAEVTSS
jgi:hydrogenase maturation protease